MRYLLTLIFCLVVGMEANGQITIKESIDKTEINNLVEETLNKLVDNGAIQEKEVIEVYKPRFIDDDLKAAATDIATYPSTEKDYIVYFTFYNIDDPKLLKKYYLELAFWVNSMSSESFVKIPQPVAESPTLFKVDIRDYGWTQQAWELVSTREPYIREPWIDHAIYNVIRTESGNNVIRGDWFIAHTSTPTKQLDFGDKQILYDTLLYAPLGHIPKNLDEYRAFWGYDIKKIEEKLKTVEQILIPAVKQNGTPGSGVARNNRVMARVNTELGYFYSTSDFFNSNGKKNVIENLYPGIMLHPDRDAGEHIGRNKIGLQHYFVDDKNGNNVHVADERIAFDRTNVHDVTISSGRSCVICHSNGINVPYNGLLAVLETKFDTETNVRYADKDFKLKADRTYFGPLSKFFDEKENRQSVIEKDRTEYNDAVRDVNGLDAGTNASYFKEVIDIYESPVTLEVAAKECGVTVQEYQDKVLRGITGEIQALAKGGAVARQVWENPENGYFAQSMLLIKGIGKTIIQTPYENIEITPQAPTVEVVEEPVYIILTKDSYLKLGDKNLTVLKKGERYEVLDIVKDWYKIKDKNNQVGYVYRKHIKLEE